MNIKGSIILISFFIVFPSHAKVANMRERDIIHYTADIYTPPSLDIGDPEKYYFPVALARFYKYGPDDIPANSYIDQLSCKGVFHFSSVGLVRILYQYQDAPAVKKDPGKIVGHHLSGNLWVSEGTENHLHMERTSGFLIAQLAMKLLPERKKEAEEKYKLMYNWIQKWGSALYRHGEGEWNSSIYHTYSLISWLNLYDFAEDPAIKETARKVIDYYTAEMALHYSWGTIGGAEMRGTGISERNRNATNYLAWFWFGGDRYGGLGMGGSQVIQSVHAVLSSYRPHPLMIALAHKEGISGSWYMNSKPSYLFEEESYVKQFFYIGNMYTLGSCISAYGGYTGACHQIVPWKLVAGREDYLPLEISGNGIYYNDWTGRSRNPYTQHVQYKNVLIQLTRTPPDAERITGEIYSIVDKWAELWARDYRKRFDKVDKPNIVTKTSSEKLSFDNLSFINLPETEYIIQDKWLIADLGNIYLAICFFNKPEEIKGKKTNKGRLLFSDRAARGQLCGYVAEVVEKEKEINSMSKLLQQLAERAPVVSSDGKVIYNSLKGFTISARYGNEGTFTEPIFDWGFGITKPYAVTYEADFRQPVWPQGKGYGKIPDLEIDGKPIPLNTVWPVFNGNEMSLKNSILKIRIDNKEYNPESN